MTLASMQVAFANRIGAVLFIVAKLLRFGFFFATLAIVFPKTAVIVGFSRDQLLLFFLVFTLIDSIAQMLFREVYRFRPRIVSGDFDLDLLKPLPSLFRPLLGGMDPMDLVTLVPFTLLTGMTIMRMGFASRLPIFIVLLIPALLIAASFHILVLALGVVTTQIDHAIMVYRDVWNMGRFPVQIYEGGVGFVLRFVIPVGIMVTVPTQVLLGQSRDIAILIPLCVSVLFFAASLRIWKYSLRHYTSASS
jgi:ABC-2 type transport system permease protein